MLISRLCGCGWASWEVSWMAGSCCRTSMRDGRLWRRIGPTAGCPGCLPPSFVDYKSFPFTHSPHPCPTFPTRSSSRFRTRLISGTAPQRRARYHPVLAPVIWSNFKAQALHRVSCALVCTALESCAWCPMTVSPCWPWSPLLVCPNNYIPMLSHGRQSALFAKWISALFFVVVVVVLLFKILCVPDPKN